MIPHDALKLPLPFLFGSGGMLQFLSQMLQTIYTFTFSNHLFEKKTDEIYQSHWVCGLLVANQSLNWRNVPKHRSHLTNLEWSGVTERRGRTGESPWVFMGSRTHSKTLRTIYIYWRAPYDWRILEDGPRARKSGAYIPKSTQCGKRLLTYKTG